MARKLATIRIVKETKAIEGADMIELALVDGWQCVVKKGEFKTGEPGVYYEIDSFLPIEERYEFLRKSSYRKIQAPLQGERAEGFRLRTVKLRGQISQGLILPLHLFPELTETAPGTDVSDALSIEKYEPPIPASLAGDARGLFPGFIQKTDEERIQNLPEYFEQYKDTAFECTEKIDGSSMTVYYTDDDQGVCSRNLNLADTPQNTLWKLTKEMELHQLLKELGRNLALQGEISGEGIQANPLKIKGQGFFLFNIWDIDKKQYLAPPQRMEVFRFLKERCDIKHVPVISESMKVFETCPTMDELLQYAIGKSLLNKNAQREGIVLKSLETIDRVLISFKAISNKYLLKHGG
ncbi:MAG: RNA ligase (ATP) [bacterium]|nr:RNA ligase (ATP) [bacterium]